MIRIRPSLALAVLALLPIAATAQDRCPVETDEELAGSKANAERRKAALENEKERLLNPRIGPLVSGMFASQKTDSSTAESPGKARYIPHLAQGHGWETYLDILNTCAEPVKYRLRFFGPTGRATKFEFGKHGRFSSVHQGDELLGGSIDTFRLTDTGAELLTGAAMLVDDGDGCVAVDTFYAQLRETDNGEKYYLYATVPLSRMATETLGLTFMNTGGCETHLAVAGTGGGVRIEASTGDDSTLGSINIEEVHHTAFPVSDRIPGTRGQEGILRIRGEAAVLGMDFCRGSLAQFRLPHLAPEPAPAPEPWMNPEERSPDELAVAESFTVELSGIRGSVFGEIRAYGVQLRLRNPTARTQVYTAKVQFKDSDGFLMMEKLLWPGKTNGPTSPCLFQCKEMVLTAGQVREFSGKIELIARESPCVYLDKSRVWISWPSERHQP